MKVLQCVGPHFDFDHERGFTPVWYVELGYADQDWFAGDDVDRPLIREKFYSFQAAERRFNQLARRHPDAEDFFEADPA